MMDLKIDIMRIADLDAVMEIENASFSMPWSLWMFQKELSDKRNSHFLVVRSGSEVAGYIGFWMAVDEAHIVTIAVRSDFRRKGVGSMLIGAALTLALRLGAVAATLEVRVSNLPAQELYKKFGFEMIAIRKGFYSDTKEDAYVMWIHDLRSKIEEIQAHIRKGPRGKEEIS